MVLVRDEQAFDAIDAGRSFAQLRETDMTTATMDEILRQNSLGLRETFEARLAGDAGVLLLREQARRIHLFERMAGCFTDHRDRER